MKAPYGILPSWRLLDAADGALDLLGRPARDAYEADMRADLWMRVRRYPSDTRRQTLALMRGENQPTGQNRYRARLILGQVYLEMKQDGVGRQWPRTNPINTHMEAA